MSNTVREQAKDQYLKTLAQQANAFADSARKKSLQWFRTPLEVLTKFDDSPVTIADREVEFVLRECIKQQFPDHGIWGEEHGQSGMNAEHIWVIDPIDGTRSFISGSPLWGTLLASLWNQEACLGLVDIPFTGERWVGVRGEQTTFNGRPCKTSDCHELEDAILLCTTIDIFTGPERKAFEALSAQTRMRRFGGDCYAYGLLASGHADIVLESELQPYDYMALIPVIEGAGGCITDWQGNTLSLDSGTQVVASANRKLHGKILKLLEQHAPASA